MTRTRKLALSVKEFSHLVSESLDIPHVAPSSQSLFDNTAVFPESSPKNHHRKSSFHRIFSRTPATPGQLGSSPDAILEELPETPRKMMGWPFSRFPRKSPPAEDEEDATDAKDPGRCHSTSPYTLTSPAAVSTSSLGSLVPTHERLFQVKSRNFDEPTQNSRLFELAAPSSGPIALRAQGDEPPTVSAHHAAAISVEAIFGNTSTTSVCASSDHSLSNGTWTSFEGTEGTHSVAYSERDGADEDPTPRAETFGPHTTLPPAEVLGHSMPVRGELSPRRIEVESSATACSALFPTSSVARDSSPTFPSGPGTSSLCVLPSTPPNACISAMFPDISSPSNPESALPFGFSPRERRRAMSRSLTPPPTGPLPAVPSSVPPVPPLPPLLNKMPMNMSLHSVISSPPRSTAPTSPAAALPPSPPGALRLPSRLSWVNSVRAALPSPPASPTKSLKSLGTKTALPVSPSKAGKKRPHELKRPTSIGVIEATDNLQVRRTKSILLLGSRSKSNVSLGTKRVQIHADVQVDADASRKARRKSSAATVGHPAMFSDAGPLITPAPSSEILVPRERRHSAPLLSSNADTTMPGICADWTLSLPFCTDVPGNKILPSPALSPRQESEQALEEDAVQGEDWTLCMPLKVRASTPTVEASEGSESVRTPLDTSEVQTAIQLPTPSPSPTWSTPRSGVLPLDEEEGEPVPVERPASPASLGPHVGGLDLAGGRGKRASGWHLYGWFDHVTMPEHAVSNDEKPVKSHVSVFRRTHDRADRHPSQESTSTVSTSETVFYSARSSLLVH